MLFFFLMFLRPPITTRTYTLCPYTPLFRSLVNGIGCRFMDRNDGVTGFVISRHLLLVLGHDHGLALGAHHDLVLGRLNLVHRDQALAPPGRSEEHTSELQSLMRISYAVFCLKQKTHYSNHVYHYSILS